MPELQLTAVSRTQGNNRALKAGDVALDGVTLSFEEVPVLVHAFRRMVRELAYDVCEMAITTYLCAKAHGKPFTALPVFLARGLHHGAIVSNPTRGASRIEDLVGARVGVNRGYTVTTGVWARAILDAEYGIAPDRVTWAPSGDEHVAEYVAPANVEPLPPGNDLAELVASGELAAAVGITADAHPDLQPLVDNADEVARTALVDRGFYPINHLVVVKDSLLAEHPDLARILFDGFVASKQQFVDGLDSVNPDELSATDRLFYDVQALTGADPLPYGVEANRVVLNDLMGYAVKQQILPRKLEFDEIFAPGTLDLHG